MQDFQINRENLDHRNKERLIYEAQEGLTEELVREISKQKNEPEWMLQKRLKAFETFSKMPMPNWGPSLDNLDLSKIRFFLRPDAQRNRTDWNEVPEDIRNTFEKLGIPQAEQKYLAGAGTQYESDVVYHNLKKEWEDKGVIFLDMDEAVQQHPELVKKYFMTTCVPMTLHKFAALHAAVWSGGTFIYVPKNVKVDLPLQAYFRMNAKKGGQFEHTLIVVDEGAQVQYIEGCFTKGNVVTTNPDYKNIEDIEVGQNVLSHDGSYKKVKEVHEMPYSGTIKKVKLWGNSLDTIEVTDDHPFLYVDKARGSERNKKFPIRWNIPKFFKKGDYLAIPINKTVISKDSHEVEIEKYDNKKKKFKFVKKDIPSTKEFFKLAGYYLAEGSISSGHYLNFSFGSHEREKINEVKSLLKNTFGVEKVLEAEHKVNNEISLVVCSTELCRIFEVFGKKANKKEIPQWMMLENPEKQRYLIDGYFKGDGNYYSKKLKSGFKETFRINSVSLKLVRQCRDILLRLGIVSFLNARDRSKENRQVMYTLGITGEYMNKFGKLVGLEVSNRLNGKNRGSMFGINKEFAFFPIRDIATKEVENEPVYNFAVEDNETYCVGGAAAHNCSAPQYTENSLHAGCVEVHVLKNARARYSSIENWSKNTYNLNTKRAVVYENGIMEWVNGNMGSHLTMLYPSTILIGNNSKNDFLGIAFAGPDQHQDTGCKVQHVGKNTSSKIISKSISKGGGITSYRGLLQVAKGAKNTKSSVNCDALMMDNKSSSNTFPYMKIDESDADIGHEATVGRISDEQIFYLMSRGLTQEQAEQMIVAGFIEPIVKQLPVEYAVEMNRLIELEMEGTLG